MGWKGVVSLSGGREGGWLRGEGGGGGGRRVGWVEEDVEGNGGAGRGDC